MALNGSISNAYKGWTYRIDWVAAQNAATNKSTITCTHFLVLGSAYSVDVGTRSNTCTVDGTSKSFTSPACSGKGKTFTLGTTTHTVTHNEDGSKSCAIKGVFNINATLGGVSVSKIETSGTVTLNSISRKSELVVGNGTLGVEKKLTVTQYSSAYKHTITWEAGSKSGTLCTKASITTLYFNSGNGNSVENLAAEAPESPSVGIVFTITTYDANGNSLGSMSPPKAYFAVPDDVAPSVSIAVSDPTGYASTFGGYVQGKSKIKVVATPTLAYESPIDKCTTTVESVAYDGATITTDAIKSNGSLTVKTTVKDKRGHTGTAQQTISVLPYSSPKITDIIAYRSDANYAANSQGKYITVKFNAVVSPLGNKNTAEYKLYYKKATATDYGEGIQLTDYTGLYEVNRGIAIFPDTSGATFDIKIEITDALGTNDEPISGGTPNPVISLKWSAARSRYWGLGLFKLAEIEGAVDLGGDVYMNGNSLHDVGALDMTGDISMNGHNINGMYPVGSIVCMAADVYPHELFGGSWTLVKKEFTDLSTTYTHNASGSPFTPTANITDSTLYVIRAGNTLKMRLDFVNDVALTDTAVQIGTIDWEKLGAKTTVQSWYAAIGYNDGGDAIVLCTIHQETGVIQVGDIIPKTDGANVPVGGKTYCMFEATIPFSQMLEEYCDKFYWKRTA